MVCHMEKDGETEAGSTAAIKIVLVSGSLRGDSVNSIAMTTIRSILRKRDSRISTPALPLHPLPFYDQDLDETGAPEIVRAARDLVGTADALIVGTPSYNGAIPGVLKNALDWLSRPWGGSALTGLPVAVLSASPSRRGAAEAQPGMHGILGCSGAVVIEHPTVALTYAEDLAVAAGEFTDPSAVSAMETVVDAVFAQLSHGTAKIPGRSGSTPSPAPRRWPRSPAGVEAPASAQAIPRPLDLPAKRDRFGGQGTSAFGDAPRQLAPIPKEVPT
jgi:chromate reductase